MNDKTLQQLLQSSRLGNRLAMTALQVDVARLWRDELAKPRNADPKRLLRYGFKSYSQCDEDGIIQELFNRIGTAGRTFIEFGVESGAECNTTKLLIEGWRGLWIEGSERHVAAIRSNLGSFLDEGRLTIAHAVVSAENVNTLFQQAGFTGEIDLLSIDIDYNDYWVWKAVEAVQPRAVVIEYNATLRPPVSAVVPYDPAGRWDGSNYFGASLEALVRLGCAKGYRIVGCCFAGSNAFFVREDLCGDRFVEPATAEEHYEPIRYFFTALPGHRAKVGPYVTV